MGLNLGERATADVVVIILAVLIGLSILLSGAAVFVLEILHPEYDTSVAVETSGELMAVIVGAVVGYIAGRATPVPQVVSAAPPETPTANG